MDARPASTLAGLLGPLLCFPALTAAGDLDVTVVDRDSRPVARAVVWLEPRSGTAIPAAAAETAVVDQVDSAFVPDVLVVRRGTEVEFPNSDAIRHHVYSFSRPNHFELALYAGRLHSPVRFEHPGLVVLGCNIHDNMIGYVYVVDTPWFGRADDTGRLDFDDVPPGSYEVVAWSPRQRDLGATSRGTVTVTDSPTRFTAAIETRMNARRFTQSQDSTWDDY